MGASTKGPVGLLLRRSSPSPSFSSLSTGKRGAPTVCQSCGRERNTGGRDRAGRGPQGAWLPGPPRATWDFSTWTSAFVAQRLWVASRVVACVCQSIRPLGSPRSGLVFYLEFSLLPEGTHCCFCGRLLLSIALRCPRDHVVSSPKIVSKAAEDSAHLWCPNSGTRVFGSS